jgi:hypothetical protein
VNVPDSKQIEIIDLKTKTVTSTWKMKDAKNYPMALDENNHRLFVGFREPSKLLIIDTEHGNEVSSMPIDGDVDDIFFDGAAKRIYLSCGSGDVDVVKQESPNTYRATGKVASRSGARTALLIPELNELIVAAPARNNLEAALLVYGMR